jgi:hypothetical protein
MQTQMQNYGSTKTYVMKNGKKHLNKINWNLNYDGDHVIGKVYVKNDNDRKQYNVSLNNNDLARLFNVNAVNKPIDSRLQDDFFNNYSRMDENGLEEEEENDHFLPPIRMSSIMVPPPNYDMNEFIEPMTHMGHMDPARTMGYRRNPTLRRRVHFHIVPVNNRSKRRLPLRWRKPARVTPYPVQAMAPAKTRKQRRRQPSLRRSLTSINK